MDYGLIGVNLLMIQALIYFRQGWPFSRELKNKLKTRRRLDISSSSSHTKRRVWQEAISALLLIDPDCAIPKKQVMAFAQARDSEYPPYLLNFMGSPGERHVENLKVCYYLVQVTTTPLDKSLARYTAKSEQLLMIKQSASPQVLILLCTGT